MNFLQITKRILLLSGIILFSITVVTLYFSMTINVPPILLIKTFVNQGYVLHHNLVRPCSAFTLNFNIYIYFVLFFSTAIAFIFQKTIVRNLEFTFQQFIFCIISVLFTLVSMNQLFNFQYYFKFEQQLFGNKSLREKNSNLYEGIVYRYSIFCHNFINGAQNAQLITDLDLNREPGMLDHRMLAYYLYPIDIRNVRRKAPDYLLFFMKRNASDHVPDNFKIIAVINKDNLIAKRK